MEDKTISFAGDVDQEIHNNHLKNTADKIIEKLKKARENPTLFNKRWIWELIQNAKDVPNKFNEVNIKIEIGKNHLAFSHNSDPFTVKNLTALVQQTSSKVSDGSNKEVTGKFGTGFITTHLLSSVINIKGVIERPDSIYRGFELQIDRNGERSEEIMPKIDSALKKLRQIDRDFPELAKYEEGRTKDSLDTVFTYELSSDSSKRAVREGLEAFEETLPITLVNLKKIKQVKILDHVKNREALYQCIDPEKGKKNVEKVTVKGKWNSSSKERNFLIYKNESLALAVEVNNFSENVLIPWGKSEPRLFRDFPLIGSHRFYFPFVLNGFQFFPTEDRSSILLNYEKSEEVKENRNILELAIEAIIEFSEYLVSIHAKNLSQLALSRLPDVHLEKEARSWYTELQQGWRQKLLELDLVELAQEGERGKLQDIVIPLFGNDEETRLAFYDLVRPFLGNSQVPAKEVLLNWIKAIGPKDEYDAWGDCQFIYGLEDFLKNLAAKENINNLKSRFRENLVFDWLNDVLKFIRQQNKSNLLEEFAILPNEHGDFKFIVDLFMEDSELPIPDAFLDILMSLGNDWRSEMLNRQIKTEHWPYETNSLREAAICINDFLKGNTSVIDGKRLNDFLEYEKSIPILLSIMEIEGENSTRGAFRNQLYKLSKSIFDHPGRSLVVKGSKDFNYGPATRKFIEAINQKIEKTGNIVNLSLVLKKSKDETIIWLDKYLQLLKKNSEFSTYLNGANIVPNRKMELCAFEDLNNYGHTDDPLDADLIAILAELDESENLLVDLVADGIGIQVNSTITQEDLCRKVEKRLEDIKAYDQYQDFREPILNLVNWAKNREEFIRKNFSNPQGLKDFIDRAFYILIIEGSEEGQEVIDLFKDQEKLKLVAQISRSEQNLGELIQLLEDSKRLGSSSKIREYIDQEIQKVSDFEYKLNIGIKVEKTLEQLLNKKFAGQDKRLVVKHTGVGENDFIITNKITGDSFFIELKSYANGKDTPIRLSLSQARASIESKKRFALCVIERPPEPYKTTQDYLKQNLVWVPKTHKLVREAYLLWEKFSKNSRKLKRGLLDISLYEEVKVAIELDAIKARQKTLEELIEKICNRLLDNKDL